MGSEIFAVISLVLRNGGIAHCFARNMIYFFCDFTGGNVCLHL